MSYTNFKAVVKKVNLKPKGVQEIVLEVSGDELSGQLERLAAMVDNLAQVELESTIVNYNIEINAATREPLIEYKVGKDGVVAEVAGPEQLEFPGLPKEIIETEQEEVAVDREAVDEFILNDMSPPYDDLPEGITGIAKRRIGGESYISLADDLGISSGKIVEIIDDYRRRIAPLAEKWWEWKQAQPVDKKVDTETSADDTKTTNEDTETTGGDTDKGVA